MYTVYACIEIDHRIPNDDVIVMSAVIIYPGLVPGRGHFLVDCCTGTRQDRVLSCAAGESAAAGIPPFVTKKVSL